MFNKEELKKFGIVALLFIWGLIAIAASAGAMNSGITFYIVMGILNILINGLGIYLTARNLKKKYK